MEKSINNNEQNRGKIMTSRKTISVRNKILRYGAYLVSIIAGFLLVDAHYFHILLDSNGVFYVIWQRTTVIFMVIAIFYSLLMVYLPKDNHHLK